MDPRLRSKEEMRQSRLRVLLATFYIAHRAKRIICPSSIRRDILSIPELRRERDSADQRPRGPDPGAAPLRAGYGSEMKGFPSGRGREERDRLDDRDIPPAGLVADC